VSVIPAPPTGPTKSTWQVNYTGFGSGTGPQAQAAFQAAVNIWSEIVSSSVPIVVNAQFAALPDGVLGEAGPSTFYGLTDGTSQAWYASALADAVTGTNVSTEVSGAPSEDIDAQFTNLADANFYFGTDGNVPSGEVDFESVVLHELGHGLGFLGSMDVANGNGSYDSPPFVFDNFVYNASSGGSTLLSLPNNSTTLASALQSQSVYWGGPDGVAADSGARPKLYAPSTWQEGSSYSHLDEGTYGIGNANSLMTPSISQQEVIHNPGPIAVGMLEDQGWTASIPTVSAPSAPTNVSAVRGDGQATVSWSAAADNGSTITGYTATSSPGGKTCTTTGALQCTVTGLSNGTSYTFTVTATNGVGPGPASSPSTAVVPAGLPGAPTGVSATAGNTSALVSWTAPSSNGSAITGYTATSSPGGKTCSTTSTPQCTVSGLTNGTSYTFTVTASNGVGTGSASSPSTAVVPAAVPGAPTGASATAGDTTALVSWTAPANNGSAITGYRSASPTAEKN
jgi:hypothetical protein